MGRKLRVNSSEENAREELAIPDAGWILDQREVFKNKIKRGFYYLCCRRSQRGVERWPTLGLRARKDTVSFLKKGDDWSNTEERGGINASIYGEQEDHEAGNTRG